MGGHIVRALTGVDKRRVFWAELVGGCFEVHSHIRVGVFVDRQTGRGMLDEDVQDSDANLLDLGKLGQDGSRDQVKPSAFGRKGDRFLVPVRQF